MGTEVETPGVSVPALRTAAIHSFLNILFPKGESLGMHHLPGLPKPGSREPLEIPQLLFRIPLPLPWTLWLLCRLAASTWRPKLPAAGALPKWLLGVLPGFPLPLPVWDTPDAVQASACASWAQASIYAPEHTSLPPTNPVFTCGWLGNEPAFVQAIFFLELKSSLL